MVSSGELIKAIALLDLTGKEVYSENNLNLTKTVFDLNKAASGIYHLKVSSNSGVSKIFKLVKQ